MKWDVVEEHENQKVHLKINKTIVRKFLKQKGYDCSEDFTDYHPKIRQRQQLIKLTKPLRYTQKVFIQQRAKKDNAVQKHFNDNFRHYINKLVENMDYNRI